MSKYLKFQATLKELERQGWIMVKDDTVTILNHAAEVKERLMQTQWGALLLMGGRQGIGLEPETPPATLDGRLERGTEIKGVK